MTADDELCGLSRREQFLQQVFGIDETAGLNISLRSAESPMEGRTIFWVEPVSRVERQKLNFGTLRKLCRLIHQEPASSDVCLERH
jgi:hypothetical protein